MSDTIAYAMKQTSGDNWSIVGKLIDRQVFVTKKGGRIRDLLILLLADKNGHIIEVKNWSTEKTFTVYHKFKLNQTLEVIGDGPLREPNRNFSMARAETYARWWINEWDDDFRFRSYIQCCSSVDEHFNSGTNNASIVGVYECVEEGPLKKGAQGYYVRLIGEDTKQFIALVWQSFKTEKKFVLSNATPGKSIILIPFARQQHERYRDKTPGEYVVTTTYPPVINPEGINPHQRRRLLEAV